MRSCTEGHPWRADHNQNEQASDLRELFSACLRGELEGAPSADSATSKLVLLIAAFNQCFGPFQVGLGAQAQFQIAGAPVTDEAHISAEVLDKLD